MFKEFVKYVSFNVFSMLGISIYILCDTYFIANGIGTSALSGLNLVLPYFSLACAIGLMVGMGTSTRFSVCLGAGRLKEAEEILIHGLLLTTVLGLLYSCLGHLYTKEIVAAMGADKELFSYSADYIGTIFLFSWAIIIYNFTSCIVRALGHPKLAMVSALLASGINLILDVVFIYYFKMGIFGAALASGISPCFAIAMQVYYFSIYEKSFDFSPCKLRFKTYMTICKLGFPTFVTEVAGGLVLTSFNFTILKLSGNLGIAVYSIIANIAIVVGAMFAGVGTGVQPIVSYNHGAGDEKAVKQLSRYAYITTTIMGLVFYVIFYFSSLEIINAFNSDNNPELISMADIGIKIYYLCLVFMGANVVKTSLLAARERAGASFMLSLCRAGLVTMPLLFWLSNNYGIIGTWATIPATEIITLLLFLGF